MSKKKVSTLAASVQGRLRHEARMTLLDFAAPNLSGYLRETVIAKFQAMVYLSTINSRMKDFCDVWRLARQFSFSGAELS